MDEDAHASFESWLADSCRRCGVPLHLTDPVTLRSVATLLGRRERVLASVTRQRAGPPETRSRSIAPTRADAGQEVA